MKRQFYILVAAISMAVILLPSCTLQKRQHASGYHIDWHNKKEAPLRYPRTHATIENFTLSDVEVPTAAIHLSVDETTTELLAGADVFRPVTKSLLSPLKFTKDMVSKPILADSCDNIILNSGTQIRGKVIEIGLEDLKYKRCDNLNGPIVVLPKYFVFMVQYANGQTENFKQSANSNTSKSEETPRKRLDVLGLIGFILTVVSIPFWWWISMLIGIIAGVIGIVFGSISMARILKRPESRKGLGFAIVSLVLGVVLVAVSLIFILLIL